jgi:hypothetical protein
MYEIPVSHKFAVDDILSDNKRFLDFYGLV